MANLCFGNSIEDYEVGKLLGKGSFAAVYSGICCKTGIEVAIKMIKKDLMQAPGMASRVNQEIAIHIKLNHPSILKLYKYFDDHRHVYLILELCHNGEMDSYIKKHTKVLTEDEARPFMRQIVEGVLYLQSQNIMHRDLKLSNLLLTNDMKIKIADFGLATQLSRLGESHRTMCGTPNYISPEVAMRRNHGLECDVWSLGCMLYTFFVGRPPFDSTEVKKTLSLVRKAEFLIPNGLSAEATDLLVSLLQKEPRDRIKLVDVLRHPFMTEQHNNNTFEKRSLKWDRQASVDSGFSVSGSSSLSSTRFTTSSRTSKPLLAFPISSCGFARSFETSTPVNKYSDDRTSPRFYSSRTDHFILNEANFNSPVLHSNSSDNRFGYSEAAYKDRHHSNEFSDSARHRTASYECQDGQHIRIDKCSMPTNKFNSFEMLEPSPPLTETNNYVRSKTPPVSDKRPHDRTNRSLPPVLKSPLNSSRLRPTRQKTKNADISILQNGEIIADFYRVQGKEEKTYESWKISPDGRKIAVTRPRKDNSRSMHENLSKVFCYDELPTVLWPKYTHVSWFVKLFRAKTPKITCYYQEAKCMLMENGPDADFEAQFNSKEKFYKSGSEVKIIDKNGAVIMVTDEEKAQNLPNELKRLLVTFKDFHRHCLEVEACLTKVEGFKGYPCFPVTLGRRPRSTPNVNSANKENVLYDRTNNINTNSSSSNNVSLGNLVTPLNKFDQRKHCELITHDRDPLALSNHNVSKDDPVVRKVPVPSIGWALQHVSGKIQVLHADGTSITYSNDQQTVSFSNEQGASEKFHLKGYLPSKIKEQLQQLSVVAQHLKKNKSPASSVST
ncbi:Serine/threonine-protein kinase plk4 [Chamberlinius hualienensis]